MKKKFKKLKTSFEANDWIESYYPKCIGKYQLEAENQIEDTLGYALYLYTGSMSFCYNKYLKDFDADVDKIIIEDNHYYKDTLTNIKHINNAFNLNIINENIVLYHYINANTKLLIKKIKENNNILILNKFISTTLLKDCKGIKDLIKRNRYNTLFKINTKKGVNCIPILWRRGNIFGTSLLNEYEIILPPKLNLKLVKVKKKSYSKIKYELEFEAV